MARLHSIIPTKERVIQIRVNEEIFNSFTKICEEKFKLTKSEVGNRIIKKFIEVNDNGHIR